MTGEELIASVISYWDNTLATDLDNTNRRLRVLNNAQMVMDEIWNHRTWPFKMKKANLTFTAGSASVPNDFSKLGPEGLLWNPSTRKFYTEIFMQDVETLRALAGETAKLFCILSEDGLTRKVYLADGTFAGTLSLFYETNPPTLVDSSSQITGIPVTYHRTVLLAGAVARTQTDKNDTRIYWEKQYLQGLARMIVSEMPLQSRNKQLPLSTGRRMW